MHQDFPVIRTTAISLILCSCTILDDPPDAYVEALKPDLYYTAELTYPAVDASVFFSTAIVKDPPMDVDVVVLTWQGRGGSLFDDTLGDATLHSPQRRANTWRWSGAVERPFAFSSFDRIGVELRTFIPVVAYEIGLPFGIYCEVELDGAGILDCGSWIDAASRLWIKCLGDVGQLVPCLLPNTLLAPAISILVLPVPETGADMPAAIPRGYYLISPELYIAEMEQGWIYRAPVPGEYGKWQPIDAHPTYGPFPTAEEALRDAIDKLDLSRVPWEDWAEAFGEDKALGRAARAMASYVAATPGSTRTGP